MIKASIKDGKITLAVRGRDAAEAKKLPTNLKLKSNGRTTHARSAMKLDLYTLERQPKVNQGKKEIVELTEKLAAADKKIKQLERKLAKAEADAKKKEEPKEES